MPQLNRISRWLLLAPLALSAFTISEAHAKDAEKYTSSDFLLNRKYQQGVSLFNVTKVRGDWDIVRYASLNGRLFKRSLQANSRSGNTATLSIPLDKKFDRFQAWVGTREGGSRNDFNVFRVLGDGQELYKSSEISAFNSIERINVSVSGVEKLELIVESTGEARNQGVFGEPKFVKDEAVKDSEVTPGTGEAVDVVRPENAPVEVKIDDEAVNFGETSPVVRGNRVLVPMRPFMEKIGATVDYNPVTHDIVLSRNGRRIDLTVGSTAARIDGQLVYLDVPVQTLSAATVYSTLKPTSPTTSSVITPAPMVEGANTSALPGTSMLPDLKNPDSSLLKATPTAKVERKDTATTVSKADLNTSVDSGPILVPLRFIAEAFQLPVGVDNY